MVHEVALRGRKCFASRGMLRSSKRCNFGFCYLVQFAERSLGPESRPTNSIEKFCRPLRSEPPLIESVAACGVRGPSCDTAAQATVLHEGASEGRCNDTWALAGTGKSSLVTWALAATGKSSGKCAN